MAERIIPTICSLGRAAGKELSIGLVGFIKTAGDRQSMWYELEAYVTNALLRKYSSVLGTQRLNSFQGFGAQLQGLSGTGLGPSITPAVNPLLPCT